jgi:diguanylate cyclase (GGDEF)-like protein
LDPGSNPGTSTNLDYRFVTLLGSDVIFGGVSLAIFFFPQFAAFLYPAYGLLFLWSDFRRETESHVIFLFLITMVGLALAGWGPTGAEKPAVFLELGGLWLLNWGIGLYRGASVDGKRAAQAREAELNQEIKDRERELEYYRSYGETADGQIRLRRDLTEVAKSLGSTLDGREVYQRLSNALTARYPKAKVQVSADASADPVLQLAMRSQTAVLVSDSKTEARLGKGPFGFRSAAATPLKVMRRLSGFVKLESDAPGAFTQDDLKTLDLFATMAGFSLENIQIYDAVHQQATHDALTQLYSHRAFQQRLKEELLRAGRSQTPLSFILCDVDHFKHYNDQYGHQAGDHLLRTLAAVIASFARPVDFPARYGGEEFCLILPNFVRTEAVDLANRIRLRVEAEPFVFQGQNTHATMSFGVSSFPQDATTPSQIIRVADERMYRAKHNGRNQVVG